jgi:hypothetical protein
MSKHQESGGKADVGNIGDADIAVKFQEKFGDSVRAVATYDEQEYEVHYSRELFDDEYETNDLEKIHEDLVLQGLGSEFQEYLFEDMGNSTGEIRMFEHGFVAHFMPTQNREGLLVCFSNEADVGVSELCRVLEDRYG